MRQPPVGTGHAASADLILSLNGIYHDPPALSARPLKGRKRFTADLSELNAHPESIARSGHWSVKSMKPGDEEASLEVVLDNPDESKTQTVILVVSDSSQYPKEHTYFGYSEDAGALESDVACVIDKLPTQTGRTLREAVEFVVEGISSSGDYGSDDGVEVNEPDDEDFMMFDEEFERSSYLLANPSQTPQALIGHLQKEFIEVKAAAYNPGIVWTGSNTFILSVSLPVPDLFHHILPHALLAWDRHFLEPGLHLTLLISGFGEVYPVLKQNGTLSPNLLRTGSTLKFKVGFTKQYKPSRDNATAAFREFFLKTADKNDKDGRSDPNSDILDLANDPDPGIFRRMSLSTSLESLLDQQLLPLLQLRRRFSLGWAGAEELLWQIETTQQDPDILFREKKKQLESAESDEKNLSQSNNLPRDSIGTSDSELNLLKITFVFLLRRLALSTRHCVVCHKKLGSYEALRPYVCSSGLCVFQYYSLNLGPSIEHEIITNTGAVDLLVSLAYVSAAEGTLDEPLLVGMGLRVRPPTRSCIAADVDGLCEFDSLHLPDMRQVITELLTSLPPIKDMKEYLQRQLTAGNTKVRLRDMDPNVSPAAWSVLRWCVASCTAHIQELTESEDRLRNLGNYRQFRFLVGAPDKEKKFLSSVPQGDHPSLFAFHGSPLKNWHSIIRHGLWFKNAAHGRSHGDGVYFCQDATVSLSGYATPSTTVWKNSMIRPSSCCTLAELVNRRHEFVWNSPPYFVVNRTEWIVCRYLLVQTKKSHVVKHSHVVNHSHGQGVREEPKAGKYLKQERNFSTRNGSITVDVPQPSYQLDKLVKACRSARKDINPEDEDRAIFDGPKEEPSNPGAKASSSMDVYATADTGRDASRAGKAWKPDEKWIRRNAKEVLLPPTESSLTATVALQREFRAIMREQNTALERNDLATLGWYLPPQHNDDNLYQWLVELHSFDPELPVAKDMKSKGVPSVAVEIRFPPSYPHAPPFFRVIRPRFKPFMEGGGGHVTVGGSICMDLLTSDGWLPSYCVSAVLLQIKLAISTTTPYPARLHKEWDRAYTPDEALRGYIRAAGIHNWKVKNEAEIRKLVMAT